MAEIIRMPRLSDTMEEGNIVEWLVKVGDQVKPGDVLAEVETDKATMDLESFHNGTLIYIGIESGTVPVDGIIAIIGDKNDDVDALLKEAEASQPAKPEPVEEKAAEAPKPAAAPVAASAPPASRPAPVAAAAPTGAHAGMIKASPLAKKMAEEKGINLQNVTGTGDSGRIIKRDIDRYLEGGGGTVVAQQGGSAPVNLNPEVQYGDIPVSQMRKVIARRLGESKFSAPHFYLTIEINMDESIAARKAINAEEGVKISFNDLVVKASAFALRKHPMINASWFGDKMTVHQEINIGVAVAVPDGLLVPVLRNTDSMSLTQINSSVRALAGKAKDKKLQPEEMSGNTFTISNLGMFDIEEFTAIINPPDACILAVGTIVKKPIVKNDELTIGNMMKVTLSCDHRVVDGATGAKFLQTLKFVLENPVRMLA